MIRLLLALLSLGFALPGVVTFHSLWGWKVTLVGSEWGHRLAVVPLGLLLWSLAGQGWSSRVAAVISAGALGIFLLPLGQALARAQRLPTEVRGSLGVVGEGRPLDFSALFFGTAPESAAAEVLVVEREAEPLRVVFHRALKTERALCLVTLHGGGWEKGSAEEFPAWNGYWTQQGYAVAAVDYRLAPKHQWPAPLEDVRDAIAHLKRNANSLGLDGQRFVLLGRSAGSQIATAAACALEDPVIRGCVAMYGPADMVFAWDYADPDDVLDSPQLLRQYMGGSADERPRQYHQGSSLLNVSPKTPPMLLVHGTRDILVWELQSRRLATELSRQGVGHCFLDLPWGTHALDYFFESPSSQLTRYAMDAFLKRCSGDGP